ncbi:MAG: hypothetical protein AB1430_14170 [Pseudomonadota bacterium]
MNAHLSRLQIAARIHFFLKRELGTGIDVETMLKRPAYAGEVLAMCDKAQGTELVELARRFRVATAQAERGNRPVPQPWAADTSGFGFTRPLEEAAPQAASSSRKSSPPSGT